MGKDQINPQSLAREQVRQLGAQLIAIKGVEDNNVFEAAMILQLQWTRLCIKRFQRHAGHGQKLRHRLGA